ncbi:MAG TPA: recombinase family protein [Saprospiraceae bacterium]|nr:recombinase family protein [Saprospiraceae bacterium]
MTTKKVGIYVRVSTSEQTTENQVRELQAHCQRQGMDVFKVYADEGISGSVSDRPALNHMLQDARQGKFEVLMVWKIDRVARSISHLLEVLADLKAHGIGFVSLTEGINTETAQGRMLASFLGAIAEFEKELIIERVRSGMARARAAGVKVGRPRKGFDVQQAISLKEDGSSWSQVAKAVGASSATVRRVITPLLKRAA